MILLKNSKHKLLYFWIISISESEIVTNLILAEIYIYNLFIGSNLYEYRFSAVYKD